MQVLEPKPFSSSFRIKAPVGSYLDCKYYHVCFHILYLFQCENTIYIMKINLMSDNLL